MNLNELLNLQIDEINKEIYRKIKLIWDNKSKPIDSLGKFEELICQIGAIQNSEVPDVSRKAVVVMCADNGIVAENISQSGQDITLAVAKVLGNNTSSVCRLAKSANAKVVPVDIGINCSEKIPGVLDRKVAMGTRDFLRHPAMTEEETLRAINVGINLVKSLKDEGINIIATGEMGIGNTTTSTALLCALTEDKVENITGRGSGLTDEGLRRKIEVIKEGIKKYKPSKENSDKEECFNLLSCLGGLDISGLVGVFIGGSIYKVPIIIDGLISAVAAYVSAILVPVSKEYMISSHKGKERGIEDILVRLNLEPYINGNMALGEGTGAVMMFPLIDMIYDFYINASTFSEYGIDNYERLS